MSNELDSLNAMQLDVLREIGNIGAGNAATTLSMMLSRKVDMSVPRVKILGFSEIAESIGGPEKLMVGILFTISEDIEGMMMFILEERFIHLILNRLLGKTLNSFSEVDDMDKSAFMEIGNIMAAAYINAMAQLTNLNINISPPAIAMDMAGAMLSVPAIEFARVGDKVLFIEDGFLGEGVNSYLILIPEMASLHKILKILGVEI